MSTKEEVLKELTEMKRIGMYVPDAAFDIIDKDVEEYYNNGMSISQIAGLLIDLATV